MILSILLTLWYIVIAVYATIRCIYITGDLTEITNDIYWAKVGLIVTIVTVLTAGIGGIVMLIVLEVISRKKARTCDRKM